MTLTVETSTAVFVKYGSPGTRDRLSVSAVIIYIDNDDLYSTTYKNLDRIARCKRFKSSDIQLLMCDLKSVQLENTYENGSFMAVDCDSAVASAVEKEFFYGKAIIWFELNATIEIARKLSLPKPSLLAPKKVVPPAATKEVQKHGILKTNSTSASDASLPRKYSKESATGSLQLPVALNRIQFPVSDPSNSGAFGDGIPLRVDPRGAGTKGVRFDPVESHSVAPKSGIAGIGSAFASACESIGIKPSLLSRAAPDPMYHSLPLSKAAAPTILKNTGKIEKRTIDVPGKVTCGIEQIIQKIDNSSDSHSSSNSGSGVEKKKEAVWVTKEYPKPVDVSLTEIEPSTEDEQMTNARGEEKEDDQAEEVGQENDDDDDDMDMEMDDGDMWTCSNTDYDENEYDENIDNKLGRTDEAEHNEPVTTDMSSSSRLWKSENNVLCANTAINLTDPECASSSTVDTGATGSVTLPTEVVRPRKSPINGIISEPNRQLMDKKAPRIGRDYQVDVVPFSTGSRRGHFPGVTKESAAGDDSARGCIWNPTDYASSEIEEYWNVLKSEQLRESRSGDFLWDVSAEDHGNSDPDLSKYDRSPSSSRITMLSETKKAKFVCVVTNLRDTIEESTGEKFINDDTELIVFDGRHEYPILSSQCEAVFGLSYCFLPEERALQILLRSDVDYTKALKACRAEIARSRTMSPEDLSSLRRRMSQHLRCTATDNVLPIPPLPSPSPIDSIARVTCGNAEEKSLEEVIFETLGGISEFDSRPLSPNISIINPNVVPDVASSSLVTDMEIFDDCDFDGMTDSVLWDTLNDNEVHDAVEDLVARIVKNSDGIQKLNESKVISDEVRDPAMNTGLTLQPDVLILQRAEDDDEEDMDTMGSWQTSRRWSANIIKVLLDALTDIRKLPRVLKNINKKQSSSNDTESDSITTGDCIYLYYLFGESYVLSPVDSKKLKDLTRDPSWPNILYSVVKKSNFLLNKQAKRLKETGVRKHIEVEDLHITTGASETLAADEVSPRAGKKNAKSATKVTSGNSLPFLANNRSLTVSTNSHVKPVKRNVGFATNGTDGAQATGSTAAFERLEKQSLTRKPSSSFVLIPENHQSLSCGSGENQLSDKDFYAFEVKFDCTKAQNSSTGLSLEGHRGIYKEVADFSGRSEGSELIKAGDYLLSIDGNDVKDMSMCGLLAFLKRRIESKIPENQQIVKDDLPFRQRYVTMSFRRITLSVSKVRISESFPKGAHPKTSKKEGGKDGNISKKRIREHEVTTEDSEAKELVKLKRKKKVAKSSFIDDEEAEFDMEKAEDDEEEMMRESMRAKKETKLIKRMKVGCQIFVDTHPATVLEIDLDTLCINVKWESGLKGWINIDLDKMVLQDDILMAPRRR